MIGADRIDHPQTKIKRPRSQGIKRKIIGIGCITGRALCGHLHRIGKAFPVRADLDEIIPAGLLVAGGPAQQSVLGVLPHSRKR